jgi:hypothetical protein
MAGTNQYLAFAYGGGANVEAPAVYAADVRRTNGNVNGVADPALCNTAWRQVTVGVAGLAQYAVDLTGSNANDDGSVSNFENLLIAAFNLNIRNYLSSGATPIRTAKTTVAIATGVVNIDFSLGNYFVVLMTASITSITFSNFPPNGIEQEVTVDFVADGTAHGVTGLASSILKWLGQSGAGSPPTFTFTNGYENTCVFKARDGVTIRVAAVFSGTAAA